MMAAARIMVVPGREGRTVPIRPTAIKTIATNHQSNSIRVTLFLEALQRKRFNPSTLQRFDVPTHFKPFDHVPAVSIVASLG
jgi:hypothetical protein